MSNSVEARPRGRGRGDGPSPSSYVSVALLLLALVCLASACSLPGKVRSAFGGELPIQISVAPHANENTPIAVDLLVVYNQKLLDELLKLPATDWFAKREQFQKDHPDDLLVEKWEWIPGQEVPTQSVSYRPGAKKVVLFADYVTEGEHRATVDPQKPFRLVLGDRDFQVEEYQ